MGKLVQGATAITEWYSKVGGDIESCGQASVAMALHVLKGTPATTDFVTQLAQETVNAGQTTDPPKASTSPRNLIWLFKQHGVSATQHAADWQQTVRAYAGVKPLVFGISHAEAFGGHDSTVSGHYICIFGVDDAGNYLCGDPNTPESTRGELVAYTMQELANARPYDPANHIVMGILLPDSNPLGGVPGLGQAAHAAGQAVRHAPGFLGIGQALADDCQLTAPSIGTWTDIPGWLWGNGKAFLLRGLIILIGTIFLLAVLMQAIKQYDPEFFEKLQSTAGSMNPAGALGGGGGAAGAIPAAGGAGGAGAAGGAGGAAGGLSGAELAAVAV